MLKKKDYLSFNTKEELFANHEKDTFRIWIWGFLVSIVILLIISIVNLVLVGLEKNAIIASFVDTLKLSDAYKSKPTSELEAVALNAYATGPLLQNILQSVCLVVALILYVKGVVTSYKNKSFHHLSGWPTTIIGLLVIINVIFLVTILTRGVSKPNLKFASNIITIVSSVLYIAIWVIFGREASFIRRAFAAYVTRERNMKMIEQLSKAAGQSGSQDLFNLFGGLSGAQQVKSQDNTPEAEIISEKTDSSNKPNNLELKLIKKGLEKTDVESFNKLQDLPNDSLFQIAQKLHIFGYEEIEKDELIIQIIKITKADNKTKK
ncbi:hypothetical protein [Mycoplasma crocodyli]|uniref:Uncharacterized protein n=1 Tax=Mycoplasma crocodyli (strain ATCC 51981 / MP145) TaxID=512564 RepID=D5E6A4_MYCCM|nr:hypothetical protein [Mycoplasma crocodyli]ADE19899.1 hypothetical protein MCRO_0696 [Mycoplasma crocodyli MP145]